MEYEESESNAEEVNFVEEEPAGGEGVVESEVVEENEERHEEDGEEVHEDAEVSYEEEEDASYNEGQQNESIDNEPQDVAEEFQQDVVSEVVEGDVHYEEDDAEYVHQDEVTQEEEIPTQEDEIEQGIIEEHQEEVVGSQEVDAGEEEDSTTQVEENQKDGEEDGNVDGAPSGIESPQIGDDEDDLKQEEDSREKVKNDESEEEDFDNVVEVEEHKVETDAEDENVAQHVSDSEDDEEQKTDEVKLGDVSDDDLRGASGSENEASDVEDTGVSPAKKRVAVLSSDEEDEAEKEKQVQEKQQAALKMFDSDSEDEQKEGVGELIADIFGESDDEGEEFTGFGVEEIGTKKSEKAKKAAISDESDDEEQPIAGDQESEDEGFKAPKSTKKSKVPEEESDSDEGVTDSGTQGMSDFDIMLAKKKEESRRHRKRRDNSTFISDADDIINAMLTKMKEAAEADREANSSRKPALKKLKMLPTVITHLKKQNLKEHFVDNGVIAAIADWLSLLPDRSMPHISIRTELLKVLHDLPSVGPETLKHSGIGKAIMILFKHPKETRQNKDSAGRLINKWSRPIFGLNENFKSMSREEREQRDLEQMPQAKRRRLTSGAQGGDTEEGRAEHELGQLRPGEAGFVMRARVPMPSTKDYVVRPKWNVDGQDRDDDEDSEDQPSRVVKRRRSAGAPRSSKKDERLEKHIRNFAERKKSSKLQRAVKISIEGNKMSIV